VVLSFVRWAKQWNRFQKPSAIRVASSLARQTFLRPVFSFPRGAIQHQRRGFLSADEAQPEVDGASRELIRFSGGACRHKNKGESELILKAKFGKRQERARVRKAAFYLERIHKRRLSVWKDSNKRRTCPAMTVDMNFGGAVKAVLLFEIAHAFDFGWTGGKVGKDMARRVRFLRQLRADGAGQAGTDFQTHLQSLPLLSCGFCRFASSTEKRCFLEPSSGCNNRYSVEHLIFWFCRFVLRFAYRLCLFASR